MLHTYATFYRYTFGKGGMKVEHSILVYGLSSEQVGQVIWAAEQNQLGEVWQTDIATDIIATNYFAAIINFAALSAEEKGLIFNYYSMIQTPLTKMEQEQILKSHGEQILFELLHLKSTESSLMIAYNLSDVEKMDIPLHFVCRDAWYRNQEDLRLQFMAHRALSS
jgi:hypothetical protein